MKTCKGNNLHIIILGKRNSGKSTLINVLLGQDFSIVSEIKGTTTDVNQKSMEMLPIGPVTIMDTAGFDDVDKLGEKRIEKTLKALNRADVAIFVTDNEAISKQETGMLEELKKREIPTLILVNKSDLNAKPENNIAEIKKYFDDVLQLSLKNDKDVKNAIIKGLLNILPKEIINPIDVLAGILDKNETAVLVIPIDKEAPKDRIILPQVQVIRNILDIGAKCAICKETELQETLSMLKFPPKLVITDSQAFKKVSEIVPRDIFLTSFSILFARLKGDLKSFIKGAEKIDELKDNDKILIAESCSHHPIEDDIGSVKIPNLIKKYTGKKLEFEKISGHDFPTDIGKYALVVHCGACMTNRREILNRILFAKTKNVAITNYGIAIAKCLGILSRSTEIFNL